MGVRDHLYAPYFPQGKEKRMVSRQVYGWDSTWKRGQKFMFFPEIEYGYYSLYLITLLSGIYLLDKIENIFILCSRIKT
jgi:hypothetical protein